MEILIITFAYIPIAVNNQYQKDAYVFWQVKNWKKFYQYTKWNSIVN